MIRRPKHSLLNFAGYMVKAFAACVFAFMTLLFFLTIFGAHDLAAALFNFYAMALCQFGASTAVVMLAGIFVESLR